MERIDQFKNLLVMAAADGSLTDREIDFLSDRSQSWGISDHEFADAIQYAIGPDAAISIPETQSERTAMLGDLLRMMAADGHLAETEKKMFANAAAQMQVEQSELDHLIDSIVNDKGNP